MTYEDQYANPEPPQPLQEEVLPFDAALAGTETEPEPEPAPQAPRFPSPDEFAEALANRMMQMQAPQAQTPHLPPQPDAPPSWDTFPGSLDEYVAARIDYDRKAHGNGGIKQAMIAVQESQQLATMSAQLPPEVASVASQWFNNLPPEHLQPGVARAILAHALGTHQLNELSKPQSQQAQAPRAVRDVGVPSGGYNAPEDQIVRNAMKQAFPHLSDKDISEMVRNNRG